VTLKPWPADAQQVEIPASHQQGRSPVQLDPASIRGTRFRKTLKGYDGSAVDSLLSDLPNRVERGEACSIELANVTFPPTRKGYNVEEVDAFLDDLGNAITDGPPGRSSG
jgi:DivIVA domain-containing protein